MKEEPFLAIWMITYNHEAFIEKAILSIIDQKTSFSIKLFIGDDCSIDATPDICKKYQNEFPNKIKLFINKKNLGPTANALNIYNACANSGAKYIALCEGDDYWTDPFKLQKQVQLLESNSNLIACHHWQYIAIEKEGKFVEVEAPTTGHGYLPQSVASVRNIFANQVRVKTRTVMFRNIIDNDFFPSWFTEVAFGDVPLSFLLGKHGDFGFIDEPMAVHRNTGKGVSTAGLKELGAKKFRIQHYKNWIQIWDYADYFYNFKYHKEASKTVIEFYKTILVTLPISLGSLLNVLNYTIFERKAPKSQKMAASKWIVLYYGKKLWSKMKRKLTTS